MLEYGGGASPVSPKGRHELDRSLLRASIRGRDAARYPSTCLGCGPAVLHHHLDGNSRVLAAIGRARRVISDPLLVSPNGQSLYSNTTYNTTSWAVRWAILGLPLIRGPFECRQKDLAPLLRGGAISFAPCAMSGHRLYGMVIKILTEMVKAERYVTFML